MARITWLAIALGLLGIGTLSTAQAADAKTDLTGTWQIEIEIAGQTGTPVFELKQKGDKLTGKYSGQFGEADVKGKVDGKKVEFSFELEDGSKAVYTATIESADVMKGEADYGGQAEGTWTGKRKKAE